MGCVLFNSVELHVTSMLADTQMLVSALLNNPALIGSEELLVIGQFKFCLCLIGYHTGNKFTETHRNGSNYPIGSERFVRTVDRLSGLCIAAKAGWIRCCEIDIDLINIQNYY